jgi:uncharacterized protein YgbK (DUF1537 family)
VTTLRLLADDLTGALDSAARFVPLVGVIPTYWSAPLALPASAAIDAGTRDATAEAARATMAGLASRLDDADIAFKKVDSLLRGWVVGELGALADRFDHCIVAPAFPFQGRIMRGGRQLVRSDAGWRDVGVDLSGAMTGWGDRLTICDAETDADLDAVVAHGRGLRGRVLWCGTGGLAGALAGRRPVPCPALPRPLLAMIGTDHAVTVRQLQGVAERHLHGAPAASVAQALTAGDMAVTIAVPAETPRAAALDHIVGAFTDTLRAIERPGTLFISGGETLRALCLALGAERLDVDGEIEPGVPTSILRGGAFDGQRVVSKSGAFGGPDFLAALLAR